MRNNTLVCTSDAYIKILNKSVSRLNCAISTEGETVLYKWEHHVEVLILRT